MGLIRYSCRCISGPHEPIPTQFGLWMFFIMFHWYMVSKTLKSNKSCLWRHRFCTVVEAYSQLAVWLVACPSNPRSLLIWRFVVDDRGSTTPPPSCITLIASSVLTGNVPIIPLIASLKTEKFTISDDWTFKNKSLLSIFTWRVNNSFSKLVQCTYFFLHVQCTKKWV